MNAFVTVPLPTGLQANRSTCPLSKRRFPSRLVPTARSLDSYREGRRFSYEDERPKREKPFSRSETAPLKKKVILVKALSKLNVASFETCGLLIRTGRVLVNGKVIRDEKARINVETDMLSINGMEYGTLRDGEPVAPPDMEFAPRTQRDRARIVEEGLDKKYSRRIDRGFYSSKRYAGGK
ncbi:hypothetical protein BWQ96_08004 [Gracilariopsis chorda]|uniref:Uncharacterized protein n=1 Tax=Gracilariopsis chorda TaxID=448386 RepID=A0A2V3IJL0_9FLOR|nr:hypothetical protein BWQ96_08004 [Gracilariopsis chorda]|eukprot:PXF42285.1 hypothetical protein BWQ96_08004 [Gracilariopsis chorda]